MKYTREQMQQVVDAWAQSGLSKKAFCRQQHIPYSNFHYWHKRLGTSPSSGFSELQVKEAASCRCEVIFPSGVRVLLDGEPSVNWSRSLADSCCPSPAFTDAICIRVAPTCAKVSTACAD
jgi:hypothetical protein